jgi:sulfur carrier protein
MNITLNGKPLDLGDSSSIQDLLEKLQIPADRVACEVNFQIIRRAVFSATRLRDGDAVEIIQAIGGG